MSAVKKTIHEKKSKRSSSTSPTRADANSEPVITEEHLKVAFNNIAAKLSKERRDFKPQHLFVDVQEDEDSVD